MTTLAEFWKDENAPFYEWEEEFFQLVNDEGHVFLGSNFREEQRFATAAEAWAFVMEDPVRRAAWRPQRVVVNVKLYNVA